MSIYLLVCPLVFLAGFVDSIAGGGGLIALPAFLMTGLPVTNCIGTNKLSSAMGTTLATYKYARFGYIPYKLAAICIVFAFAGSSIGANIALLIDDTIFRWILLVVLPLTGIYVCSPKALREDKEPLSTGKTVILASLISLVLGVYDGFYGPGTGTFLILLLTSVAHLSAGKANGLSKAINLSTNYAALAVYLLNGRTIIPLGLLAGSFNMLGAYCGTTLYKKTGTSALKKVMLAVLVIFFVKTIIELF